MSGAADTTDKPRRGYRNPPIEYRFRKGVSGNPRGRPRKQRALVATKIGGELAVGLEDRIKSLAIEEAYRPVFVREGDQVERMPAIRAILRKIVRAAASGDARAQQMILKLVAGAEADRGAAASELLRTAVHYKESCDQILAERARNGATGPELVPHPDDVIIDHKTGEVRIEGPVLQEQKAALDQLRRRWVELERDLLQIDKLLESDPQNSSLRRQKQASTKITRLLRDDAQKRLLRDALRKPPKV